MCPLRGGCEDLTAVLYDWHTLADVSYKPTAFACDTASHHIECMSVCPLHVSTIYMYNYLQEAIPVQTRRSMFSHICITVSSVMTLNEHLVKTFKMTVS
jgi:hypothetical protein